MTEIATVQNRATSVSTEADEFWVKHAWSQESLNIFEEAMREWDVPRVSLFMFAWCEFIDATAILNPVWLPPIEYATAMARLAYAKQDTGNSDPSDEDLIRKGLLPLTIAKFQPEWVDHLEEFPYAGSHITFALTNPTLTAEAVTKIVNRKTGDSFLLDHTTAFSWLNAAKHPNASKATLMKLAFYKVPQFASYGRISKDQVVARIDRLEQQVDQILLGAHGLPFGEHTAPRWERKKSDASTPKWEVDFDKKIASALLSREDLPWAARKFLEFKGYEEALPVACSVVHSPVFSQAYVAGMWSGADWARAGVDYVEEIPSGLRIQPYQGRPQGAIFAPLIPGRSSLVKHLLVYASEWLTFEGRRDMYPVSHKAFAYLGGLLRLVRDRASQEGFDSAEDIPLEWLLEVFPISSKAELTELGKYAPEVKVYGSPNGQKEANSLVSVRNEVLKRDPHFARSTIASSLVQANEYYFNNAIALSREEGLRNA